MRASEESDDALVARAGRGDRLAATALVVRHTDRLMATCYRLCGDRSFAEDAVQETFLRMWKNAGKWRPGGARLETWLYRVAMNVCIDRFRRQRHEAPADAAPEAPDDAPNAVERLMQSERDKALLAALAALPERQRAAIAFCHFQEFSNIETAEIMEISVEAVESLLARGRRALRERLSDRRGELMREAGHDRYI